MMWSDLRTPSFLQAVLGLTLTAVAGFVDAVAYLSLAHLYVANMSGNSVGLGISVGLRDMDETFRRCLPVGSFVLGLLLCEFLLAALKRMQVRRLIAGAMAAELACLVLLLLVMGDSNHPKVFAAAVMTLLAAMAMGAQNAALRGCGVLDAYTTHVTGTLTRLAKDLARWLISRKRRPRPAKILLAAGLWTAYVAGAASGAIAQHQWGLASIAWATLPIGTILIADLIRPMAKPRRLEPRSSAAH